MRRPLHLLVPIAVLMTQGQAFAQEEKEEKEEDAFSGRTRLNFSLSQGNSNTLGLAGLVEGALKLDLAYNEFQVAYDLGYANETKTRERVTASLAVGLRPLRGLVLSLRTSVLSDVFAGYDARFLIGADAQLLPLDRETIKLSLSLTPGVVIERAVNMNEFQNSFSLEGRAKLWWKPAERVAFETDLGALYTAFGTTVTGRASIEFTLIESLSAGIQTVANYYTDPPANRLEWDVRTGAVLSLGF